MSCKTTASYHDGNLSSPDSDELQQIIYSSSSHDRSSVGSIPWAEDAIKQNQQEWQRVERMFYGEEDLPKDDVELRREIIEWTTAFPHLRIVGKSVKTEKNASASEDDDDETETLKDNSPECNILPPKMHLLNESFIIHPEAKSIFLQMDMSDLLERDLRINSVPMLSRRRQFTQLASAQNNSSPLWKHSFVRPQSPPKTQSGRLTMRRQIFPWNSTSSIIPSAINNLSKKPVASSATRSAKIVRMPPIVNFIMPPHTKYLQSSSGRQQLLVTTTESMRKKSSLSKRPVPVVLPVLNLDRGDVTREALNRSISAADSERQLRALYLSNSASKLKVAK